MKYTILMPCLNEAETISKCINKARKSIIRLRLDAEILIADNGSTDDSIQIAKSLGARVINVKEPGYGSALYMGCKKAKGNFIIMGDSDDSYDFSKLSEFVKQLNNGADIVNGNRFKGGISVGAMPWKNRFIGNPLLSFFGKIFFNCPVNDFHCGLRAITKNAFLKLDLRTNGMEFASEMLIKACLLKLDIREIPVKLHKDGRSRPPHLKPWRDGWRHLKFMLIFCPNVLFIMPGFFFLIFSSLFYIYLLSGPKVIYGISFDIHTFYVLQSLIILSFIGILLGISLKIFGYREGLFSENSLIKFINKNSMLEAGALVGVILFILGFYILFDAIYFWKFFDYGLIDYGVLLREISISTLFLMLGGILFLFSLLAGFMNLPLRK